MACSLALSNPQLWKRHLLGYQEARTWLRRAGLLSTLRIRIVEGRWPFAHVNGRPFPVPVADGQLRDDLPLDPGELCRSITTDDECWLFTCECSERGCARINSGIFVVHAEGLVIWRSPDEPGKALAVFGQQEYESVVFAALRALLRNPPRYSGLNWSMSIEPDRLRKRLEDAQAGRIW